MLGGIALGRDALSLRLVAVGALAVMLLWPESVAGPSFQLSFAAVTAIIALHSLPWMRRRFGPSDGGLLSRFGRGMMALLATGLAVEIALMPFALYHFHKAGLYGVAANMVAIPWTTFVIMPLEALALLLDTIGLGHGRGRRRAGRSTNCSGWRAGSAGWRARLPACRACRAAPSR